MVTPDTAAADIVRITGLRKRFGTNEVLKGCLLYTSPSPRD